MSVKCIDLWQRKKRLYAALIDVTAAYDSVEHEPLFAHLQQQGVPLFLRRCLADMYDGAQYILLDGDKVAVTVPTRGVKQGCPTSPTLYDLYTNWSRWMDMVKDRSLCD